MTLLELKERIEDAIEEYGAHPVVTLMPMHYDLFTPIKGIHFDLCVNCDTDEEEVDLGFRV